MKRLLTAVVGYLGLVALEPAHAVPIDFTYTGSLVDFAVPATGPYQIIAFGAQGGSGRIGVLVGLGGQGAEIGGTFTFAAGEILQIAVGGKGGDGTGFGAGGGGGGGSFVVGPGNTPLIIAGGGGGGGELEVGQGGLTGPDGGGGLGGTGGNGGGAPANSAGGAGGGGGGFLTAGGTQTAGTAQLGGGGGGAFPDLTGGLGIFNPELGGVGGDGGFGGGGGGSVSSGGGGGYSGGAGGMGDHTVLPGGGGGSFDAGTDQILVADFQTGDGEIMITELIPEPASIALLGSGLAGLMLIWLWRLRRQLS